MKISQEGIALIKKFEGCELNAYQCSANVWTIGYGHTKEVAENNECSMEEAEEILVADLEEFEMKRWNRAGGVVVDGLVRRREAEALLFKGEAWEDV